MAEFCRGLLRTLLRVAVPAAVRSFGSILASPPNDGRSSGCHRPQQQARSQRTTLWRAGAAAAAAAGSATIYLHAVAWRAFRGGATAPSVVTALPRDILGGVGAGVHLSHRAGFGAIWARRPPQRRLPVCLALLSPVTFFSSVSS